jgi:indolepyruvate ferredoxin oxidoreductase alpha subunit
MTLKRLNGDQALAYGAIVSGIKMVTGYPGSPSSGTVEELVKHAKGANFYVEWCSNEKVAVEMAIGASIVGSRALVCVKSVGMNVMVDPLMALNLTPLNGGLVILLGDDPGGYGSQNDQDTRPLATMLEIPMMEPSSPSEAFFMMRHAFKLSQQYKTAVIIRETRSFTQQIEDILISDKSIKKVNFGFTKEPFRFVPVPKNVVSKHRQLHKRIAEISQLVEELPYNTEKGIGTKGIIACGFTYKKLIDVLGSNQFLDTGILKLSSIYPLPQRLITNFLLKYPEVLILEENEPYLESQIKTIAYDSECETNIFGKLNRFVHREGELFRWQIQESLEKFMPGFNPGNTYNRRGEAEERPHKKNFCGECTYYEIIDIIEDVAKDIGQKLILVGDPGCLVTVAHRIDAKYAMGSAVAVADGMSKVGGQERIVALFGDSSFFHSSIPAICNAVHNRSNIILVVLDNGTTATSGFQPHPGVARDAMGNPVPALCIEQISKACGINRIFSIDFNESKGDLFNNFKRALSHSGITLILIRTQWPKPE